MLTKTDILAYLSEMNDEMASLAIHGEVVLCGGAVMTLVYDARQATKDIDALYEPAARMREIAAKIAQNHALDSDWFNDGAKGFIDTSRMGFETVKVFSNLTVKAPDAKGMLALKLASARENSKDTDDALFLMNHIGIESEQELFDTVEDNIHPQRLTAHAHFFIKEMYSRYRNGLEEKGR